jgi:hypothetical protein
MSDAASKERSSPPGGFREVVGFGKPGPHAGRDLDRAMRRIAAMLQRDFARQIAENAKVFKKRVVHKLKLYLPPGPGRPAEASITKAVELRKLGLDWMQIYPQCIPNHAQLDPPTRRMAELNLRAARRSRLNTARRRRRNKRQGKFSGLPIHGENVPSSRPTGPGLNV